MRRRSSRVDPKDCYFCKSNETPNYKEAAVLRRYMTERGKILSATRTGVCARHQRLLRKEILRARFLALVPYVEKPL